MKKIDHPNIVKLVDIYEDERFWCLVMELMKGGELFDQILEREHFSEVEARQYTKAMIDAISYCHDKDIVHRDLKPENLLLSDNSISEANIKVADFGLARLLDEDTLASTTCGTPGYVAPEVLERKKYGKECDNWSIGVITYIMLSGTPPFHEEEPFALFEQIKACRYEFDDESWEFVSEEAKDFISKILVADPSKRLTCAEMMAHPWMKKDLNSEKKLLKAKNKLLKYVSVRREKSKKGKLGHGDDDL